MKALILSLALSSTAGASCDTSFLLQPGTFTYQDPDIGTKTVKIVVSANGVTTSTTLDGDTYTATYTCQGGQLTFNSGKATADLSMFPKSNQWRPGYTWTFQSKSSAGKSDVTVNGKGHIVSLERITTPAGSFNAYRLDVTYTVNLGSEASKLPKSMVTKMAAPHQNTYWVARGVGIVKTSGDVNETLIRFSR